MVVMNPNKPVAIAATRFSPPKAQRIPVSKMDVFSGQKARIHLIIDHNSK